MVFDPMMDQDLGQAIVHWNRTMTAIQGQVQDAANPYWKPRIDPTNPEDANRKEGTFLFHTASAVMGGWVVKGAGKVRMAGKFGDAAEFAAKAAQRGSYFEVNGLQFNEYYYNKLWSTGRGASSLVAK